MEKKKIAIVALLKGGIGHYISQLYPFLEQDYDIEIISYKYGLPGDRIYFDDPAITRNIKKQPHFLLKFKNQKDIEESIIKTLDFIKFEKIDILNFHIGTIARATTSLLIPIIESSKKMGVKILYTFHDVEPFEKFQEGEETLKLFYNLADGGTVGNQDEERKLLEKFNFPKEKLVEAKHAIYDIFDFKKYDQKSARKHLGIPLDKKVILNFGILRPYKGFDDMVKAMPEILKKHQEAFLYVSAGVRVFGGPEDIVKLSKDLHLEKDSKMVFDFVPSEEIEPIFKAADIVVLPYKKVSQSGILNVDLFFNKPVILSKLFVEAEKINNIMGLTIDPNSPDQIAKAVNKLLDDSELYNKFVTNIEDFVKHNSWQETADSYKKIINKITN